MNLTVQTIENNLHYIQNCIIRAAQSSGRSSSPIRLVVVTKGQPVDVVKLVIEAGVKILGENYPEESVTKMKSLNEPKGISWHMIGHLQSRKSGLVAQNFNVLESLDSLKLANRLEKQLTDLDRILPVMLEMNVSGEESKIGWPVFEEKSWHLILPDVEKILAMRHLKLMGLMTMPPLFDNPEKVRPYFIRLRKLGDFLASYYGEGPFQEYSMGTSMDFQTAVQEGATMVRIGQAILGPRPT